MDESSAMRQLESVRDLSSNAQRVGQRQRSCERPAFDVLQHQVIRPDVVDLANMRMIQRGDCTRFLLEPGSVVALQLLNGDDATKTCVACLPHFTHATGTEGREDFVGPQTIS